MHSHAELQNDKTSILYIQLKQNLHSKVSINLTLNYIILLKDQFQEFIIQAIIMLNRLKNLLIIRIYLDHL
jgi:hypothetical protein